MDKQRFNVCILSATLTDVFSNELVKGAVAAARRLDINLTIMPGKYLGIQHFNDRYEAYYEYQYNVLFGYAAKARFDYIIAPVGTIAYASNSELKKNFLDSFEGTPVLKKHLQKEVLLSMLDEDKTVNLSYRLMINDDIQYMNMNAVKMKDSKGTPCLVIFTLIPPIYYPPAVLVSIKRKTVVDVSSVPVRTSDYPRRDIPRSFRRG